MLSSAASHWLGRNRSPKPRSVFQCGAPARGNIPGTPFVERQRRSTRRVAGDESLLERRSWNVETFFLFVDSRLSFLLNLLHTRIYWVVTGFSFFIHQIQIIDPWALLYYRFVNSSYSGADSYYWWKLKALQRWSLMKSWIILSTYFLIIRTVLKMKDPHNKDHGDDINNEDRSKHGQNRGKRKENLKKKEKRRSKTKNKWSTS